jgi:peptidoglycan hydrolase-like protein with peptidoglycan-binding domain
MFKKAVLIFVCLMFLVSLTGCARFTRKKDLEIKNLKNQITDLEAQIQAKDQEISSLKESLAKREEEKKIIATAAEVKSRPTIKHIQIALRNAGYNPGPIDAKMGKQTRQAIRAFQKANNLVVDGKVGKQTWCLLSKYLEQKVK